MAKSVQYSSNQFAKAILGDDISTQQQAQLMEQVNVDVVDMVNQILNYEGFSEIKPPVFVPMKSTQDVAYVVAQAMARLRIILEKTNEVIG